MRAVERTKPSAHKLNAAQSHEFSYASLAHRACVVCRGRSTDVRLRQPRPVARGPRAPNRAVSDQGSMAAPQLPRVMRLRDVVLFNITAIVGLRWLTTAASQFGLAALGLWLVAMTIFFLPSALAVRELADIDPGAGGIYRWVRSAFGPVHGFVAGWGYWVNNLFYFPSLLVATAAITAYAAGPRFVHLGEDPGFIAVVSLLALWLAFGMNLVGLIV